MQLISNKYDSFAKIIYHLNQTFGSLFKKNDYNVNFDDIFTKHDVTQMPKTCADALVTVEENYKKFLKLSKYVSYFDKKSHQKLVTNELIGLLDEYYNVAPEQRNVQFMGRQSADDMLFRGLSHMNALIITSTHMAQMKAIFKIQSDVNDIEKARKQKHKM